MTETTGDYSVENIISNIDQRGYCLVPDVIPMAKVDLVKNVLHDLLANEITDDVRKLKSQRVGKIAVKNPLFLDLMCHPLVLEIWRSFIGDDVICATWSANTVYPGHDRFGWHADYPYWSIKPPWPDANLAGQTLWLLDDFTEENGATGVVPFSHRLGHPPDDPTDQWRDDGEILAGKAGSVVFAHGAWWHTARPNHTDHSRSCLLGMYMLPCFITQEDMRGQLMELTNPTELVRQLMGENQHLPTNVGAE